MSLMVVTRKDLGLGRRLLDRGAAGLGARAVERRSTLSKSAESQPLSTRASKSGRAFDLAGGIPAGPLTDVADAAALAKRPPFLD
jgi:hypothetical protein